MSDGKDKTAAGRNPGSDVPRADPPAHVERQYVPLTIGFSAFDLVFAACVAMCILSIGISIGRLLADRGN